ncbi:MAG: SusE domain-containing protein [Capnocytophaga sp.]|nr:SusE domain-containing protein [Capnocytophaga sp.]
MKNIFKTTLMTFGLLLFVACEKDEDKAVLSSDAAVNATLSTNSVVLEQANADAAALTVTWTTTGFNLPVVQNDYEVSFVYKDKPENVVTEASPLELTVQQLNTILTKLGLTVGEATDVEVKVTSKLSDTSVITSTAHTLNVTTYKDVIDLSTAWGVVGSITSWGGSPDVPFWKVAGDDNSYVAYVTVVGSGQEIKFRKDSDWADNYGDDGTNGSLESGGANIPVAEGVYRILWNINDNTYKIEKYTWGIIGDGANGWGDTDDIPLSYDGTTDTWVAKGVTLSNGSIKFRFNNAWTTSWGDKDGDGVLDTENDNNIAVTAGTYDISVNFSADPPTYTIE